MCATETHSVLGAYKAIVEVNANPNTSRCCLFRAKQNLLEFIL